MKLIDALELVRAQLPENALPLKVFLACGFTPLHLQTFLIAELRRLFPNHRIEIETGLFGDLAGNLERLNPTEFDIAAVAIEWEDLDSRLGIRRLGGWRPTDLPDIIGSANKQGARLAQDLKQISRSVLTCVCMPTLPLPPIFFTRRLQNISCELELFQIVASLGVSISNEPSIRIVGVQRLNELSPLSDRLDVKTDIMAGFPYSLNHASIIAELLAALIQNPNPKKGLITDLDDTLWSGILGEVGVDGISWHMDQNSHMHGLYQQLLASLAGAGVLIAIASKNDPTLVDQAFERKDLLLPRDGVFPFEIHWTRKSESVRRILQTWNVGPDAVVFVDDSPMEVAEVKTAFSDMECIVFPKNDYLAIWKLFQHLRDLFGKDTISQEDQIRLQSIRNASVLRGALEITGSSLDDFLQSAEASVLFTFGTRPKEARALELINKTNQFNLNGKRFSESDWTNVMNDPGRFLVTVTYEDKYGPLGKVAVILGKSDGRKVFVESFVMSCRAFSRRIEYQCLKYLFQKFGVEEIVFNYAPTARNGPIQDFFLQLLESAPGSDLRLVKTRFLGKVPSLFHRVEEKASE